jgi:hypothetical protein
MGLFAVFDGFLGAQVDAGHAVGAVFAPDRLPVLHADVCQRADSRALAAGNAFVSSDKGL